MQYTPKFGSCWHVDVHAGPAKTAPALKLDLVPSTTTSCYNITVTSFD